MRNAGLARVVVFSVLGLGLASSAAANQRFSQLVGPVPVGTVATTASLKVPYIFWGGDIATFHANGGTTTQPGSIFAKQGLNVELSAGDDFVAQVRDYLSGKSPFLRGTFRMLGMASEVLGADPRTKPVVFLQMTWSAGDHLVVRPGISTIQDLRGKTIALQQGGPHVGMLDDVLRTAGLSWNEIKIHWVDNITGPKGPATAFSRQRHVDACFVVTPDMIALTGGLTSVGTGAEGTVKGARVLDSTAYRSYTIADVYAVRSDFLRDNRAWVTKFAAGYLKAVESVIDLRQQKHPDYRKLLDLAVSIYGKTALPNRDEADGLLADCTFVGHPGNVAFFTEPKNPRGFDSFLERSLNLAVARGYASQRRPLLPSPLDWQSADFVGYLSKTTVARGERFQAEIVREELERLNTGGGLDDTTIYAFTITFEPNQDEFSANTYGKDFRRVIDLASEYGGAVIAVRGHADPTRVLAAVVKVGLDKNVLQRTGGPGNYRYALKGKPFDLQATQAVQKLILSGAFDGGGAYDNPREIMQAALNLSLRRAEAVRHAVIAFAQKNKLKVDQSQIHAQGVGIREPFIAVPRNMEDVKKNTRVEFRLIGVSAEASKASDFDF